jgi:hypothetical protein
MGDKKKKEEEVAEWNEMNSYTSGRAIGTWQAYNARLEKLSGSTSISNAHI